MLRTLFFLAGFFPWTLFVLLAGLPLSLLGPDTLHHWAHLWARGSLWLAGVKVRCAGAEHLRPGAAVVYMPNHQSNFDILALLACIRPPFRWLAKKELFAIPLFGTAMRRAGCIAVDRADHQSAMASMDEAARRIRAGEAVMIFPEGTRSLNGRLQPFKKGGFVTAIKAQAPIVPIAITGSGSILPKHARCLRPGTIAVTVLPPIDTRAMSLDDRDLLMERVRQNLENILPAAEAEAT
ncbi:lysophospholipid acyltransferase family protein [Geoalkalibacter sp.]|uniref:lysophospholipid acyltransferase family protein n=1 Tax=Geoalkalibacter sp. TaxID=3041440 RepID=UPI00272E5A14|nr:lysophospholipid acyltransferase family protein [Geoalkalibacter sp.]